MTNTAQFRRANRQPGYRHMPRDEYVQRAHEFAPRGERLSRKLTRQDVIAVRENAAGMTDKQRAASLGISASMVYKIRKRERWGTA